MCHKLLKFLVTEHKRVKNNLNFKLSHLGSRTRNPSLNDSLPTVFNMQTILKIVIQLSTGLKAQPPDHRWISKV